MANIMGVNVPDRCPDCGHEMLPPIAVQDAGNKWWLRCRCQNVNCPFYVNISQKGETDPRKIPVM